MPILTSTDSFTDTTPLHEVGGSARATSLNLQDFSDLDIASDSIIKGIIVRISMAGVLLNDNGAYFKLSNGASISSAKATNELEFTNFPLFSNITVGSSTDLWGLTWDSTTAENPIFLWDVNLGGGSTAYFDNIIIEVFSEAPGSGLVKVQSGRIKIISGLVSI